MTIFGIFFLVLKLLNAIALLVIGLFIWRKFKDDFETQTIGGILAITSVIFFLMSLRATLWGFGWIDENLARDMFFFSYTIILFLILPFALPRFLYLVFNRQSAKKIGLILGIGLYLTYLIIHFNQRENIITRYTIHGLSFEPPLAEKVFIVAVFIFFLPFMLYRISIHFSQWRKTKAFPYKFLEYLLLFFVGALSLVSVVPRIVPWQGVLAFIFALAGVLAMYLISSQELIKKGEFVQISLDKEKERPEELERLRKLTTELKKEIDLRAEEAEKANLRIKELKKEIERLQKERE